MEIDILRTLAIAGVIVIHVGALALSVSKGQTLINYITLDQFLRFCVPLFVALSGYALALRYKDEKINYWEFLTRRALRLIPWYLFWSTVLLAYQKIPPWYDGLKSVSKVIFMGDADYHLYFVPMIFVLYLLFPILIALYKKFSLKFLALIFLLEITFYYFLAQLSINFVLSDQQQYILAPTWIFYFVLGIALCFMGKIPRYLKAAIVISVPIAFYWTLKNCFDIAKTYDLIIATRFTRIPVLFYTSAFITFAIIYAKKLLVLPPKITEVLANMGKRSYVTYLCHTLILRVVTERIALTSNFRILTVAVITIIASDQLARASIFTVKYVQQSLNSKRVI